MAVEEATYTVVQRDGEFEIRDYAPYVVAETVVAGAFERAGNEAFRALFRYISGGNRSRRKVAMTAPVSQEATGEKIAMTTPVSQEAAGEKIAMTAPVGQQSSQGRWAVSFTMPASFTLETLPEPADPRVTLRQVPARRMAVLRYSGFWTESGYLRHKTRLESWVRSKGLLVAGDPVWARYNAPFTPWFLRRNEILLPVSADQAA
jgi:hypothetical protein